MPGAQAIGWVLRQAFGNDDEPDNPEQTLRKIFGGGALADMLTKGVPKMAGMDISGRVGAGGMLSLLPYADISASRKGYESLVTAALGPFVGGLMPRFMDGADLMHRGQYWQGLEMFLPKGFADASKAVRFNAEGVTNRRGDQLMSAEDVSALATIGQMVGLPTTSLSDRSARSSAMYQADQHFNNRSTSVKQHYVDAYRANDVSGLKEARAAWDALQDARERNGYKRQPMHELLKAPQQRAKNERFVVDGVQFNRKNVGAADLLR